MTILDSLRAEMKLRGLTDSQCNSRAVAIALDVFTRSGAKYESMQKEETEISERLATLRWSLRDAERKIEMAKEKEKQLKNWEKGIEQQIKDAEAAICECETAEGRDTMRAAQLFLTRVTANSDWDNKYYISALGAILSRGNMSADMPRRKEEEE